MAPAPSASLCAMVQMPRPCDVLGHWIAVREHYLDSHKGGA